jgi:hypothetical protein
MGVLLIPSRSRMDSSASRHTDRSRFAGRSGGCDLRGHESPTSSIWRRPIPSNESKMHDGIIGAAALRALIRKKGLEVFPA